MNRSLLRISQVPEVVREDAHVQTPKIPVEGRWDQRMGLDSSHGGVHGPGEPRDLMRCFVFVPIDGLRNVTFGRWTNQHVPCHGR